MSKDRMGETHQNKAQNNRGTTEIPTSLPNQKNSSDGKKLPQKNDKKRG